MQLGRQRRIAVQPDQSVVAAGALQRRHAQAQRWQVADDGVPVLWRAGAAQQVQRFLHGIHAAYVQAPVRQDQFQALAQARIGGDQQHARLGAVRRRAQVADHLQQRDLEPEGGAFAGDGVQADPAVHQVDDALADGQAQAGAAVQAGGGGVGLGEGAEQAFLLVGVDADAGVAHFEAQQVLGIGLAHPPHVYLDAAALGELDRVDHKVAEDLPQAHRVAAYRQAHRRVEHQGDVQALVFGRALHQLQQRIEQFAQVEGGDLQLQPLRFELGVIEDVVDDAEQRACAFAGGVEHFALLRGQRPPRDHLQHGDDAVERGADLVAHGGQELALGQHRRLGVLLGPQQLLLQLDMALLFLAQALQFALVVAGTLREHLGGIGQRACGERRQQRAQAGERGQGRGDELCGCRRWQPRRRAGGHREHRGGHGPAVRRAHVRAPRSGSRSPARCRPTAPRCPG